MPCGGSLQRYEEQDGCAEKDGTLESPKAEGEKNTWRIVWLHCFVVAEQVVDVCRIVNKACIDGRPRGTIKPGSTQPMDYVETPAKAFGALDW